MSGEQDTNAEHGTKRGARHETRSTARNAEHGTKRGAGMSEDQDLFRPGGVPGSGRTPAAHALPAGDVAALYEVVAGRRDVRNGFRPDPIADDVLTRVLTAAHQAPSVGLSQPWDFIVLRDRAVRERVHALARRQQQVFAARLPGPRARAFRDLKVEAILDTPLNIVVTCDPTRGGLARAGPARPAAGRGVFDRVRRAELLAGRPG